jgi:GntR family transcriptional repressor for pyruvate dehydrogenase complex
MASTEPTKQRLSERIADDLQRSIVKDGLVAGRKLPTESELMERYEVSRSVVREAARLLVQRGLVTVSPGRGMLVAEFDGSQIAEQFSLLMLASNGTFEQLMDLRLALEVQVATAAARSATEPDLERMAELISQGSMVRPHGDSGDISAFLDSDLGFHEALAQACGNPFLQLVCQPINMFLRSHYSHRDLYPSSPEETLEEHEEILQAIASRDTFHAHQTMQHHLRRLIRKAPAMPPPENGSFSSSGVRS